MEAILNFQENINIELLDKVVLALYGANEAERKLADATLNKFKEHPDSWQRVDSILEFSKSDYTKFFALQILDNLIKTKWNVLPRDQCEGIRNFIVSLIISNASDEASLARHKMFIQKLNSTLVEILKQDWPKKWPTFITEIVNSSRSHVSLCENNMVILRLLSEEVFDFSADLMTTIKSKNLKEQLCQEFSLVYRLCDEVLDGATKPSLMLATLNALLRFLKWIPLGYIFETNLIEKLRDKCLRVDAYRNVALSCYTEVASLSIGSEYDQRFLTMFSICIEILAATLPLGVAEGMFDSVKRVILELHKKFDSLNEENQLFIQNLALFLTSFFSTHLSLLEASNVGDLLMNAHYYLLAISRIEDREMFKTCLEYWIKLVSGLYNEFPFAVEQSPLLLGSLVQTNSRKSFYSSILSRLRLIMIERMVKPEEVLIVEGDNGEIIRERTKETDTITLYKSVRECLVYLTHLDCDDTEEIMTEKLARQVDGSEWSWNNLNKLCWAIGSISGAMNELVEKRFLVSIIRDLLGLTEMKKGKDNKAVVASNIMYIVGQYPRFLKAHWKFLKTVVKKLFEFMHETHEGVQDMACDTYIKIAQKCRRHFVLHQIEEPSPYIDEILLTLPMIISDLSPAQIHVFYEATGYMIQSQPDKVIQTALIAKLMEMPNNSWSNIISQTAQNPASFENLDNVKTLVNILQTNVAACTSIGPGFVVQLGQIYMDMLSLYRKCNQYISEAVRKQGLVATQTPLIRGMRSIKTETLKFVDIYVQKCEDINVVVENMLPPLLEIILGDYAVSVEPARDAQVLNVVSTFISRVGVIDLMLDTNPKAAMSDKVVVVLNSVFECTLNMINKDFHNYPDHRIAFFKLLQYINMHCFSALLTLPAPQFKLIMDSVVWAIKHTGRDISDTGLTICFDLLTNIASSSQQVATSFYKTYFLSLLQDIFYVLTDTSHKSGFKLQAAILANMFGQANTLQVIIFDPNNTIPNRKFVTDYVINLLCSAFSNLQRVQVETFVLGLFDLNHDITQFKLHLRDFLISLKEFTGNNDELYLEERELEQERKRLADEKIPGLLNPHETKDDTMDA